MALAVGADGVLVGRPPLWGLGTFGAAGAGKKARFTRNDKTSLRNVIEMVRWIDPCME